MFDSNGRITRKLYPEPNYKLSLDEGVLFISENSPKQKNIGVTFGSWLSTHKNNDKYPIGEPPLGFGIGLNKISSGIYSHLYSNHKNIDWYIRVGSSNSNTELISKYFGGGIIYKLKDTSTFGISFGSAGFSKLYKSIFDYRVQNSEHPYEHVIELSFKTKESKFYRFFGSSIFKEENIIINFQLNQIYNIPLIQKGIRIEIYFFMVLELQ